MIGSAVWEWSTGNEGGNRAPANHEAQGGPEKVTADQKGEQNQVRDSCCAEWTAHAKTQGQGLGAHKTLLSNWTLIFNLILLAFLKQLRQILSPEPLS